MTRRRAPSRNSCDSAAASSSASPTESAPLYGTTYPEPFRLDYAKWAEEIARLSLQHNNLTTWVIDDFYVNHALYTPAYVGQMQARAHKLNPKLRFFPQQGLELIWV